jgi:exopolysaccharide biosynthesis protein
MIYDNILCNLDSVRFNLTRHPRTALGITDDYHLLLVTVDGRHAEAAGMNMWELQDLMKQLDCSEAMNFDGGGSTTMYIKGKTENGVVNYPSDNRKYDHEGERKVANAIVVVKK